MLTVREIKDSFLHLLFPHVCAGCGSDLLDNRSSLCLKCIHSMPRTHFEEYPGNPVEKRFWGRLNIRAATAQYYFTRDSLMQRLMHQFKYRGQEELGFQLGRMMGENIKESGRFPVDALIALPLFASKERKRGFNQSAVLCQGISEVIKAPVLQGVVIRATHTETQTSKSRIERWANIEGKFLLKDPAAVRAKHILLVDDVVTTGATLEACGSEILKADAELSIATLCYASK